MCQNYYRNIENNQELISFLSEFGIDYRYTEEIFSYDLGDKKESWISSEAYYGVEGDFDGEGLSLMGCSLIYWKRRKIGLKKVGWSELKRFLRNISDI